MIQAYKNTTLTDLQVKTLNIREKELNYWQTTFQTMASQSALIAGFCYGGLSVAISDKSSTLITFGYLSTTTCGMAFGLLCITIASFCVMFGPGLALRGGEGAQSMHKAIECMKTESTTCFIFFILQLLFFHLSSFLLMWLYYPIKVAIFINIVLAVFLGIFIKNGVEIFQKLYVKDDDAVTGQFSNFNMYENMQDLDQNKMQRSPTGGRGRSGSDINRNSLGKLEVEPNNQRFVASGTNNPFDFQLNTLEYTLAIYNKAFFQPKLFLTYSLDGMIE